LQRPESETSLTHGVPLHAELYHYVAACCYTCQPHDFFKDL
jgi:hypothetical protein